MLDFDVNPTLAKYQQDEPMMVCNDVPSLHRNDWSYSMRRTMQEIIPGLFLGPYSAAQKTSQKVLQEHGITHIICVRQDVEAALIKPQLSHIAYLTLNIADAVTENIIRFFPKVRLFIDEALANDGKVLVHGTNGISRSATLVLAYIMEKFTLSCKEAVDLVKKRRLCIHPNEGFLAQLVEYEPIYKARQTLELGAASTTERRQKRKSEQLSECGDYDLIQPPPSPISENNNCENYNLGDFSNDLYKLWITRS